MYSREMGLKQISCFCLFRKKVVPGQLNAEVFAEPLKRQLLGSVSQFCTLWI